MENLIAWIQTLKITQGDRAGMPFEVMPWQRRFLRGAFKPSVRHAALSVARANGKTTLCSGIAISAVLGPLRRARAECILVASSFTQARLGFEHAVGFLTAAQRKRLRILDNSNTALIECRETGARLRCIAADPRRAHGLAPSLVLADEPAQWGPSGDRLFAALATSQGKIAGSRIIALGTRPESASHWFSGLLRGDRRGVYAQCHAAAPGSPVSSEKAWRASNPSWSHMPVLRASVRAEAKDAEKDPMLVPQFKALRLNQGVADTAQAFLLSAEAWRRIEGDAPRSGAYVLGIDLGQSAAMSATVGFWPETGRLEGVGVFPCEPPLPERSLRDGAGNAYQAAADRGELLCMGHRVADVEQMVLEALARWGKPQMVVADRFREAELRQVLERARFPKTGLSLRGQGWRDGSEDVRLFRRACLREEVRPAPSVLLRHCVGNARLVSDAAGNLKLARRCAGGRRQNARDDAAAAAVLSVAAGVRSAGDRLENAAVRHVTI